MQEAATSFETSVRSEVGKVEGEVDSTAAELNKAVEALAEPKAVDEAKPVYEAKPADEAKAPEETKSGDAKHA
jgi:hypothetical protein